MKDTASNAMNAVKGAGKAVGNAAMGAVTGAAHAAGVVAGGAGAAADFVREAEPDAELRANTESSLDGAGSALIDAAPAIGRGAEKAAEKVGQALNAISRPCATVLGAVAGTLGGWWNKAAEERLALPETEEQACRAHFASIAVPSPGMPYDRARTGYALGYVASRNPGYGGRRFEDVETELRRGFGEQHAADYDALREFTRYSYDRGMSGSV